MNLLNSILRTACASMNGSKKASLYSPFFLPILIGEYSSVAFQASSLTLQQNKIGFCGASETVDNKRTPAKILNPRISFQDTFRELSRGSILQVRLMGSEENSSEEKDISSSDNENMISLRRGFEELVTQSSDFVDNSLFIKDIIEDGAGVVALTMPPHSGKSVNLEMLKRFLEIPVDQDGAKVDKTITENYKLFAGGDIDGPDGRKKTLSPLKISNDMIWDAFGIIRSVDIQGTFPVIYFELKDCAASTDLSSLKANLRRALHDCFREHLYLENSDKLTEGDKTVFRRYADSTSYKTLATFDIETGLHFLSDILFEHHNCEVWVLIDDYDAATNVAQREFSKPDYEEAIRIFTSIYLRLLKSNPYLRRGVLTGSLSKEQTGNICAPNNVVETEALPKKYFRHYGSYDE